MHFLAAGLMTPADITVVLLGLGLLLLVARLLGEISQRFGQPAVLGELCAGLLLGPSILGHIFPGVQEYLFPKEGSAALFLDGFSALAISLYLLVAGMEVNLSTVWKQGKAAVFVGTTGIVIPFALGFGVAWFAPYEMGMDQGKESVFIFALFMATALSISALPVIAKTLMDLNIFRSDFGMIIVAAAIFNDLIGWIIFAMILGMMGGDNEKAGLSIPMVIAATLGFAAFVLTVGRWLIHRILPWLQANTTWPGGVLSFALGLALLGAAVTEWLGIHAIFGAFLVGIAIGDSPRFTQRTRSILEEFISFIFAPLFFASVGLRIDFLAHFDLGLCIVVLGIACIGKVVGCSLGARWAGMDWNQSIGVGFGMNARGTMEIILGLLALQYGVINDRLFVALVVMALVTSMMSGPALQRVLKRRKPWKVADMLSAKTFVRPIQASERHAAIKELATVAAKAAGEDPAAVADAVWNREEIIPTGIGSELAVPHARLEGLSRPVVVLGVSPRGIDFNAPDGEPARLVFLILTPMKDTGAQLDLLADIGRTFKDARKRALVLQAENATDLRALLKTTAAPDSHGHEPGNPHPA